MGLTSIEWTATIGPDGTVHPGHTNNPWWGCTKYSPGCANCYADGIDQRFHADDPHWGPKAPRRLRVQAAIEELEVIGRRFDRTGVRASVFAMSMGDIAEVNPSLDDPRKVYWEALHRLAPKMRFLILSKRAEHLSLLASALGWPEGACAGTSVENQEAANTRIPHLLTIPARVRFLSCEPLLGPVKIDHMDVESHPVADGLSSIGAYQINPLTGRNTDMGRPCPDVPRIHWVIVGGESGHNARPMQIEWVRSLRDQCNDARVPFFFKQMMNGGVKLAVPKLDGRVWQEFPNAER